jgi:zinc protease
MLAFLAVSILPCAGSRETATEDVFVPPEITTRTLENGLTVLVQEQHEQQLVALEIVVKTGSVFEQEWQGSGIAHLVEHMLFKGHAESIEQEIRALGGSLNGYTAHQITGYTLVLPSRHFSHGLSLLAEMFKNPVFDEQDLSKEKNVILSEIKMNRDDPERFAHDVFWKQAYASAPYNLPVIGLEPLLMQIHRDEVAAFYRRWYVPNNMVLSIAGDVTAQTALPEVSRVFGGLSMKPFPQALLPVNAPLLGRHDYEEQYPGQTAFMIVGFPSVALTEPDAPVLDIIAALMGRGESSRLYKRLVKDEKLVYGVSASNYTPGFRGIFSVQCVLEPGDKLKVLEELFAAFLNLKKQPVSFDELEKVKNSYIAESVFQQETVESLASVMASDYVYTGNPRFSRAYLDAAARVKAQDVQRCARDYFSEDKCVTVMLRPKDAQEPEAPLKQTAATITTLRTLKNGMRVLLKKDPAFPTVSVQVCIGGGTRFEHNADNGLFHLISTMLLSGTKKNKAEEIVGHFERRGAHIDVFSGYNSYGLNAHFLNKDLPSEMAMIADILCNSIFPEEELSLKKKIVKKNIALQNDDIFQNSAQVLREHLFQDYPYRLNPLGTEKTIQGIFRQQLVDAHARSLRAENIVLAVVGDIDEVQALRLVEKYFSAIPSGKAPSAPVFAEPVRSERAVVKHVLEKKQAVVMIGFQGCTVSDQDRFALEFLSELLSGQGSILYERIREQQGLAYTLGGTAVFGLDTGYWLLCVATRPEAVETVTAIILEALDALRSKGVDEQTLSAVKNYCLGNHHIRLQSNVARSFEMGLNELYGLGADYEQRFEYEMNNLSAATVQAAAEKYLQPEKSVLVITQE